jgi:hypothetical protein
VQRAECQHCPSVHESKLKIVVFSATLLGAQEQLGKRGAKWLVAWLPRREDDSSNQQVSKPTWPAWVSSQIYPHHLQPSPQACHRLGISLVILGSQLADLDVHEWTKDAKAERKSNYDRQLPLGPFERVGIQ